MNKLIVNSPTFNKEAIKADMFIVSKEKTNEKVMRGIIVKVEDTKIHFIISAAGGATRTVSLDAVLNGRAIINVGYSLEEPEDKSEGLISEARVSRDMMGGQVISAQLNVYTNKHNKHIAGMTFNEVYVDGQKFIRHVFQPVNPYITTTSPFTASVSNVNQGGNK